MTQFIWPKAFCSRKKKKKKKGSLFTVCFFFSSGHSVRIYVSLAVAFGICLSNQKLETWGPMTCQNSQHMLQSEDCRPDRLQRELGRTNECG